METLIRNVRYAFRAAVQAPAFTATVVATLALGIGATSAVFSAIDAVLIQPLPFPHSERLVRITQSKGTPVAPPQLEDWNRLASAFEAITGYYAEDVSDTTGDLPEKVRRAMVAPRFLEVWGISPAIGRGFTAADFRAGGVVLISDRYWRSRFAADPNVLDRSVRLGSRASSSIIGVMPPSFDFPDRDVDLWVPVATDPYHLSRLFKWYSAIGRLKPGVTLGEAEANLTLVQSQLGARFPQTDREIAVQLESLKETMVSGAGGSLWLLLGAVSVLLLIACANVAALWLSRFARREEEIAVRLALGASRGAVALQVLTETGLLAFAGGVLGVLAAAAAATAFRALAPDLPRIDDLAIDWRVMLFAMASAAAVTLLCGAVPAVRSARFAESLQRVGRGEVSSRHPLQWVLVGVQVVLSVTLLAGAGLLLRSFERLSRVDPGFNPSHVLTFHVTGGYYETNDYARLIQRIDRTLDTIGVLPGVESAATAAMLPGVGGGYSQSFEWVGGPTSVQSEMIAEGRMVSPGYFKTVQIPLLGGELCRQRPDAWMPTAELDVMVNRSFVDRYLAGRPPIGLHLLGVNGSQPRGRIVGVVGDARETGMDRDPAPTVYYCFNAPSAPDPTPMFLVRTRGDPMAMANAIRLTMKQLEPLRSVYDIAPLTERISDAFAQNRLRTVLIAIFAGAALALTCLGVYGTLSYTVALREREVGLKLALGAPRGHVIARFLIEALSVVGLACLGGLALSFVFARILSGMLFGVAPTDPATLSAVIAVMMVVAAVAALLPAARAAALDPMRALREE